MDLSGSKDPQAVAARIRLQAVLDDLPKDVDLPFPPRSQSAFAIQAKERKSAESSGPLPFGPFHLPEGKYGLTFTAAFRALRSPEEAEAFLAAARTKKMRVVVHLAGSRGAHQGQDGSFSPELFAKRLEAFRGVDFAPYVRDGTVLGHMLFDEPHDPGNWNGKPVSPETIDAAAAVSKRLFPTMPVGIGSPASYLRDGAPYRHLDFAYAQYVVKRGDLRAWLQQEATAAQQARLKLGLGLNVLGGGGAGRQPMTPAQLRAFGTAMAREPSSCFLLMWKWDDAYFSRPDIQKALKDIAQAAGKR